MFRRIEALPFSRESSELFDRPSINLGRISGGDAINKVPDHCSMDLDIRYLPGQDPGEILEQIRRDPGRRGDADVLPHPGARLAHEPLRARPLRRDRPLDARRGHERRARRRVRRGLVPRRWGSPPSSSGPTGAGHHGPDEWVSIASLARYRRALSDFVADLPSYLEAGPGLRSVDGGLGLA